MLQDMAVRTASTLISEETGRKLKTVTVNEIRTEINETDSDYDREKLQERLAK